MADLLAKVGRQPEYVDELIEREFESLSRLVHDQLFLCLLSNTPIPDKQIELLLTGIRRYLLFRSGLTERQETPFKLSFVCALARQCYLNEYVYLARGDEVAALATFQTEHLDADGWIRLCILASYVMLNETAAARMSLDSVPVVARPIVREQIEEPKLEDSLGRSIEVLRAVEDDVSRAVQTQYEENPFPRWTRSQTRTPRTLREAVRIRLPNLTESQLPDVEAPQVLIAGCGTGLQTMNAINSYARASIMTVDLSRKSLAYGMRKLSEYGVTSVRHLQADILDLGILPQRFDLIESFGVLHHMRDPSQGLNVLASLLKPGALIFLGLYSELARKSVVAARKLIAERGYPSGVEGIRAARRDIMMGGIPELTELVSPASDFWTTSECRDLIFHAQEHRFTLLEIDRLLGNAGLQFLGLELTWSSDQQRFASEFPAREASLSLRVWHEYETRYPDTFGDTYRIWAKRG